jgi:hypothetical protein
MNDRDTSPNAWFEKCPRTKTNRTKPDSSLNLLVIFLPHSISLDRLVPFSTKTEPDETNYSSCSGSGNNIGNAI